jgi:hypothetical protein
MKQDESERIGIVSLVVALYDQKRDSQHGMTAVGVGSPRGVRDA